MAFGALCLVAGRCGCPPAPLWGEAGAQEGAIIMFLAELVTSLNYLLIEWLEFESVLIHCRGICPWRGQKLVFTIL